MFSRLRKIPCLFLHINGCHQILREDIFPFVFQGSGKIPPSSREFGNNARCHIVAEPKIVSWVFLGNKKMIS